MVGAIVRLIIRVVPRGLWTVLRLGTAMLTGMGARRRAQRVFEAELREHGMSAEAAASLGEEFPRLNFSEMKGLISNR